MADPKTWKDYLAEQGLDPDEAPAGVPEAATTPELIQAIPEELPVSPGALQEQQRSTQSTAYQHALDTAAPGEGRFESAARAEQLAAPIVETPAPPNPVIGGPVEALARMYYGAEFPKVADLPPSEQALYGLETLAPSLTPARPMLEAARTGDVAGAAGRYAEEIGTTAGAAVDLLKPRVGIGADIPGAFDEATANAGELLTRPTRIGDDVILSESPTQRIMRTVGTSLAGIPTSLLHEAATEATPGGLLKSPLERVTGYALPTLLDPLESMKASPQKLRDVVDFATGRFAGLNDGEWGDMAVALTQNADEPFISERAEVIERGELPWSWTSDSYLPEAMRDPIASYVQEVARGRGLRELGAETAITAGFGQGSPQYDAMARLGLIADVVLPLDEVPMVALGKLGQVGKAGAMGATLDKLAGTGNYSTAFAATMAELGRTGGSVDAVKPAVAAFGQELAAGRGVEAFDRMRASGYTGRKLAETIDAIFTAQHGKTIGQHLADAKNAPPPSAPPNVTPPGSPPPAPPASPQGPAGNASAGGFEDPALLHIDETPDEPPIELALPGDRKIEIMATAERLLKQLPADALPDDPINGPIWRAAQEAESRLVRERDMDMTSTGDDTERMGTEIGTSIRIGLDPDRTVLLSGEPTNPAMKSLVEPMRQVMREEKRAGLLDAADQFADGAVERRDKAQRIKMASEYPTDIDFGPSIAELQDPDGSMQRAADRVFRPTRSLGATFTDMVLSEADDLPLADMREFLHGEVTEALTNRDAMQWAARREQPAPLSVEPPVLNDEVTQSGVTMRIPQGRPRGEAGVARLDVPVSEGKLPRLAEVSGDEARGWQNEGYQGATTNKPQPMKLRFLGGLLDDAIDRMAKRTARELEEQRALAKTAEARAVAAETQLEQLPKYTAEEEAAREAGLRSPSLFAQSAMNASQMPDVASVVAAAARTDAERLVRPDLKRVMLAYADLVDPTVTLEIKHAARVDLELFQGRPVAEVPIAEIAHAVERGEIAHEDAARAIGLAGTHAGAPGVGAVPEMRAFSMDPTSPKDFAGFHQRLIDQGGGKIRGNEARLQEIAALAQERGAKYRYGDQGDPSWLDVLDPDTVTEFAAIKAKRLLGKAKRLLGKEAAAKLDQFELASLLFRQGFHPDPAVRQGAIDTMADLSARLDAAEGKEKLTAKRAPLAAAAVKGTDEASLAKAVESAQPPAEPKTHSPQHTFKLALGYMLGKPDGAKALPVSPRRALESAGYKAEPKTWSLDRALDIDKRDGSFDFQARLLEGQRDLDGEKYVLVNDDTNEMITDISGEGRAGTLIGPVPKTKARGKDVDNSNCAAITISSKRFRKPGWRIMVKGSKRPIAEWVLLETQRDLGNGRKVSVELRPVYGASVQEAAVIEKLAAKIMADEVGVAGGVDVSRFNAEATWISPRGRRGAYTPILPALVEAGMKAVTSPKAPKLAPDLQMVADAVEAGMRSYMRAGTRRVPFVGGVMVTPAERGELMAKMKAELAPLYDMDAYYDGKGGLKVDELGQLKLTPDQRQTFWNLSEKYGLPTPDVARAERAVTPLDTRKLHGAMAQVMAGRSAWTAHAFPEVSAWSWVAQSAIAHASFNKAEDYLQHGSEKLGGATRALLDIDGARLRLVAPAAANELSRWVHTLSGVAVEVSRKVQEARAAGALQSPAMWKALTSEGWKPIGAATSNNIDRALTKGLSLEDAAKIADEVLATEDAALPARMRGEFEAKMKAATTPEEMTAAKSELAKEWAIQRAAERRKYAQWWVEAVAPGLQSSELNAVLRRIHPDRDAALDKVYRDAFVDPKPEGFGQFERPTGVWTETLEWYRGGGKLAYLSEHTSLGKALSQGGWRAPAEDVTVFNFAVRLRSEVVYQDAIRAILGNHMAVPKGRISELVADMLLGTPESGTMAYAAERGYAPTDVIEAQRVITQMGLDTGDRASLHALGGDDDALTTKYIADQLEEAKAYGLTDSSAITGWKNFDAVMRFWKQSALGKLGLLSSPARFIGDALGAFPQTYLVRGWEGVGDLVKHAPDPAAWALGAHLAEMRRRQFSPAKFAGFQHRTFAFPTGVWTADELLDAFRARGIDAQAARSETAGALIDESRRFDFDRTRRVFAMEDRRQLANELGNLVDMQFRVRIALGELRRGADIDTACLAAREALYDYSGLTKVERHLLRTVFPWYTFMKRNAEAVLKALVTNPQRVTHLSRMTYKQPDLWGWNEDEKSKVSPSGWGGVWFASERGELDTDHKGRAYMLTGVNVVDVIPMVVGLLTDPVEEGPKVLKQNLNPFLFHTIEDALAGVGQRPEWSERGNEVPAAWMVTPGLGAWLKWALGVEAVNLKDGEDRSNATTWDERNRPQKWVVGHRFDQQGAGQRAQMAREAWWAINTLGGRAPDQMRAWASGVGMAAGAPFPEETRLPDQSGVGAGAQVVGGRPVEQLTEERLKSDARRNAVRDMRAQTTEAFGPKNTLDAGVGSLQR
jgi:hypothetical protein